MVKRITYSFKIDDKKRTTELITQDKIGKMNIAVKRKGEINQEIIGIIVALLKNNMIKKETISQIVELLKDDFKSK